jgi:hypothetical protein
MMEKFYHNWPFYILEDGSLEFGDESPPDRFYMQEGDTFRCVYKNNRTVLVKIKEENENRNEL